MHGALGGFDSRPRSLTAIIYAARLPGEQKLDTRFPSSQPTCQDEYAYWQGLIELWPDPTLTIICVEHDMEFSDELVDGLLACPHPRCAYAYQMHLKWGMPHDYWAFSVDGQTGIGHWGNQGDEWAAWSAIGFCKIAPEARGPFPEGNLISQPWMLVEQSVNYALRRHAGVVEGLWHVHWRPDGRGVEHYHYK